MFRALLWKEWRELWVLPVAAVPLAALSFFLTKTETHRLAPVVWEICFALWLLLAAVYIPTHLYAREKDVKTADFLFSRPLDRFRLWWLRLLIGIASLAGMGIVLYAVTMGLTHSYQADNAFDIYRDNTVRAAIYTAIFLFSLSAVFSAVLRKQVTAIVGVIIALIAIYAILLIARYGVSVPSGFWAFTNNLNEPFVRSLVISPALLFISLLLFARGKVRKQTRSRVAFAYSFAVLAALVPMAAGLDFALPDLKLLGKTPGTPTIRIMDISEDGTRMLLSLYDQAERLVAFDLSRKQVNMIDRGLIYGSALTPRDEGIIYFKQRRIGPLRISKQGIQIQSDFTGENKTVSSRSSWGDWYWLKQVPKISPDGAYLATTASTDVKLRESGYVKITDSSGKKLWKQEFPVLEKALIYPMGWDYQSRFYFGKSYEKGYDHREYWRVGRDDRGDFVPEQVPNLTAQNMWRLRVHGGRWIRYLKVIPGGYRGRHEYWIYDIAKEENRLLSISTLETEWSKDGTLTAYLERIGDEPETEQGRPIPFNLSINLAIYEPATGNRFSVLVENTMEAWLEAFSPSNKYLLLGSNRREPLLFSLDTRKITKIQLPEKDWNSICDHWQHQLIWIGEDRLLWVSQNRLFVTETAGSNPREIFRFEGNRFYIDGKEQS